MRFFLPQHDVYLKNAERIGDLVAVHHHTLGAVAQVDLNWDALRLLVRCPSPPSSSSTAAIV